MSEPLTTSGPFDDILAMVDLGLSALAKGNLDAIKTELKAIKDTAAEALDGGEPGELFSWLIEIKYGTAAGVRTAEHTVHAASYGEAYATARAEQATRRGVRKIFGGRQIGQRLRITQAGTP